MYNDNNADSTARILALAALANGGGGGSAEVIVDVNALPTSDIKDNVIYRLRITLVPSGTDYEYYIYKAGAWKKLATQSDLDKKQDLLVSGTNIKTINGNSLLGAGNISVKTYQPFPNGEIHGTLEQVVDAILNFPSTEQGMAYLGGISGSCTPFGYGNVECTVTFMADYLAVLSVSSSNMDPYRWEYNTAQGDYIWRKWSDVTVSSTGSSTDEVKYITIDGVEKKLAGGGTNIFVQATQPTSFKAGDIWYDTVGTYTITPTLTHCTGSATNPTTITEGSTATLAFTASGGYDLPSLVTVTGATSNWDQATGTLVLSNPTGNVSVTITATAKVYTITTTVVHCRKVSGPDTITYGTTATLTFGADEGYNLPDSVDVINASSNWTKETGTLNIYDAIGNVDVYVTCTGDEDIPLCFTANTANSKVGLIKRGSATWTGSYSLDGTNWIEYVPQTTWGSGKITLPNVGDKIYFKGDISSNFSDSNYLMFQMDGSISASGNCNSMYVSNGFGNLTSLTYKYCYCNLFINCTSLTTVPTLPATTLSNGCYKGMFSGCTELITPPLLPATELKMECYSNMFSNCSKLTSMPQLTASTLGWNCYTGMFANCVSLTTAQPLPATTLANSCYQGMFSDCTSLTNPPIELPATRLVGSCYENMFKNCQSMTTPPKILANISDSYCCRNMFNGCISLTTVPILSSKYLNTECYVNMFSGCTSLQISDTQTTEAPYAWTIPSSDTFTRNSTMSGAFTNCAGTRSSDDIVSVSGEQLTYYTQNQPV